MIDELKYGNTNTYLIKGHKYILFDTDWAGTFSAFCKALKSKKVELSDIEYLVVSHFHPDHMGLAGQLMEFGIKPVVFDVQKEYIHFADSIFSKEKQKEYIPIDDERIIPVKIDDSRQFLHEAGIEGEIIHTPGHSEDSISLWLDEGCLLVGDLNPLYELPLHEGTQIGNTWKILLRLNPKVVCYGHAKTDNLTGNEATGRTDPVESNGKRELVSAIMKYVDKKYSLEKIQKKTGADMIFIEDVVRMYLTHQNVSVQGILDRIEIKNK